MAKFFGIFMMALAWIFILLGLYGFLIPALLESNSDANVVIGFSLGALGIFGFIGGGWYLIKQTIKAIEESEIA